MACPYPYRPYSAASLAVRIATGSPPVACRSCSCSVIIDRSRPRRRQPGRTATQVTPATGCTGATGKRHLLGQDGGRRDQFLVRQRIPYPDVAIEFQVRNHQVVQEVARRVLAEGRGIQVKDVVEVGLRQRANPKVG